MRNRDQSFSTQLGGELGCLGEKVIPRRERLTPEYLEFNLPLVLDVGFAWHRWIEVDKRLTFRLSDRELVAPTYQPKRHRPIRWSRLVRCSH